MNSAFFLSSVSQHSSSEKGHKHIAELARRYGFSYSKVRCGEIDISIAGDTPVSSPAKAQSFGFVLGRDGDALTQDRFLKVDIEDNKIRLENDYAGSIPVFYASRNGLALSNIEPAVFHASDGCLNDLDAANVFGFLKFNHFIWDETAWSHIHQTLPDSETIFDARSGKVTSKYLQTVHSSDAMVGMEDTRVAEHFYELNAELVKQSMAADGEIILPLSSGYDSRLILAAISENPEMAEKTKCFTYGAPGSIEVHAARALSREANVYWSHIDLPCQFLERDCLSEIGDVFGASLHMHGMYQLEFWNEIKAHHGVRDTAVLTSGFMTGVPAGQHNGLLGITRPDASLVKAMSHFSQSKVWSNEELLKMPLFDKSDALELAESRFRKAFDRFDGEVHQKAVMFDVWTRQRNFISYYPRTFEWLVPTRSPHMRADYANFFMSISQEMLFNRKAVEMMFTNHYPAMAKVASNSNGFFSLGGSAMNLKFLASRIMGKLGLSALVPESYRGQAADFDLRAVRHSQEASLYPLFEDNRLAIEFAAQFGGQDLFRGEYQKAFNGGISSYEKLISLQAFATNIQASTEVI
jgi:hypothetical protein